MRDVVAFVAVSLCLLQSAAAVEDSAPPSIVHEACEQYKKGQAFEIRARLLDDSAIFEPKVIYRAGSENWKSAALVREGTTDVFKATIKGKDLKGPLEYFIEAFDEFGNGPARYGSPEAPIRVLASVNPAPCQQITELQPQSGFEATRPDSSGGTAAGSTTDLNAGPGASSKPGVDLRQEPPPAPGGVCSGPEQPLYCSPWLWGAAGAVVIGGGTLAYILLRGSSPTTENVRIHVTVPAPALTGLSVRLP